MNDKTRREFLKNCFQIGGYAGIACFGMGAIDDARGWGILPAVVTSAAAPTWADWDELTEAGLASDNTFVVMEENVNAGGNETGQGGGLTGNDLVLTDVGSVDGATGTPPTRVNDASSGQTWPLTAQNLMFNSATWTLIFKANITAFTDNQYFSVLGACAAGQNQLQITYISDNTLSCTFCQNGVSENQTSGAVTATGIQWVAAWATGGVMKAGIATIRPTKLTDFSTVLTFAVNTGDMSAGSFASNLSVWKHPGGNGILGNLYYMVASKLCLIE